jgi:hypothetical protein
MAQACHSHFFPPHFSSTPLRAHTLLDLGYGESYLYNRTYRSNADDLPHALFLLLWIVHVYVGLVCSKEVC